MTEAQIDPRAAGPESVRWLVLFGVWLIYFCFGLTIASLAPLVGPVSSELGIGNAQMRTDTPKK
ncbi:MAG: hypothetical protein HKO95_14475 [Rhodobacteraceae bacterium]|nr:hypothetical protein [Alphaproteobacteria bacterium]NNK67929.1 hypothetical protein [Paracoccaceae bacterium]